MDCDWLPGYGLRRAGLAIIEESPLLVLGGVAVRDDLGDEGFEFVHGSMRARASAGDRVPFIF